MIINKLLRLTNSYQSNKPDEPIPEEYGLNIPLTFIALEDNTVICFAKNDIPNPPYYSINIQYKINNENWTNYQFNQNITLLHKNDKLQFKTLNDYDFLNIQYNDYYGYYYFKILSGSADVANNILSLIHNNFESYGTKYFTGTAACFSRLFINCTNLINANKLLVPYMECTEGAFAKMFYNCTNLLTAPKLLDVYLSDEAYLEMFYNCTSLSSISISLNSWNFTENWVKNVAANGVFKKPWNLSTEFGNNRIPNGWIVEDIVDETTPLTFIAVEPNTTVQIYEHDDPLPGDLLSSTNGTTWNKCRVNTNITLANIGDKVMIKHTGNMFSEAGAMNWHTIRINNGLADVQGNLYSLINFNKISVVIDTPFYRTFENCKIRHAKNLLIPQFANITDICYCYQYMFNNCTTLISAPELPAILGSNCYEGMFAGCTSLSSIKVNFTDWYDKTQRPNLATSNWLSNVSNTGNFYYKEGLDVTQKDASHVPPNWTPIKF